MIASFQARAVAAGILGASMGFAQGPPAQVRIDPVQFESIQERRVVTGEVRSRQRSLVAAREPGLIVEMGADAATSVKAGDVLARLDSGRLELSLATLRAQRAAAEVAVDQRREEAAQAERDLETTRELVEKKTVGEKRLVDATSAHNVARLVLAQAESQLEVLQAQQAELELRIEDTRVRAPFDGVVVVKRAEVGQWLAVGDPLVELLAVGALEVWLDVPQRYAAELVGESASERSIDVRIEALDLGLELADGRAIPQVDPRARTFKFIVPLPPRPGGAKGVSAGMSVTASVPSGGETRHWTVARDAILRGDSGSYFYVAQPGPEGAPGTAARIPAVELFDTGGRVAVRCDGIEAGALAIVEGNERLFPGASVIAAPAGGAGQRAGVK